MADRDGFRIGNQTSFSAMPLAAPFEYAIENGFNAFEWFPDKKESGAGWSEADIPKGMREDIRNAALDHDIRLSVHAPWPSNPLKAEDHFSSAVRFAQDIGAALFNIHLDAARGIEYYVEGIRPLLEAAGKAGMQLSIENTPETTPQDFSRLFGLLRKFGVDDPGRIGMCLDLGHANLCRQTQNDYLRYIDLLDPDVPILHVHLHENLGDSDSHLPIFTGPSAKDDSGIRGFLERLRRRGFAGSIILEQWPNPPSLLDQARRRLIEMIEALTVVPPDENSVTAMHETSRDQVSHEAGKSNDFVAMIVSADKQHKSWRKKLAWIQGLFDDRDFDLTDERLACLAVYLRLVGTGQVPVGEDGGHYRPSHHAQIARYIYERLRKIETPDNAFIVRKIYPWLPSFDTPFMRAEPLTRIRDIAHRNDIPRELKEEIKHTLQNKLHRSAGPEDLVVSRALLERITAPGAAYPDAFVEEFRKFHEELKEFFNARSLAEQLSAIAERQDKELIGRFLKIKDQTSSAAEMIAAFSVLTDLRRRFGEQLSRNVTAEGQALQSADIMLEDFSFALLSALLNDLMKAEKVVDWKSVLNCLLLMVENLRFGGFDEKECTAIENEIITWSSDFDAKDRVKLLRLKATAERAWRLAEGYAGRILQLFPEIASQLGHDLGVGEDSIRVFGEAVIRAHPVFQLSKLVSFILRKIRVLAALPSWDIIVPGRATGYLTQGETLEGLSGPADKPLLALLKRVEGDEEIPANVRAILTGEETPLLSHLAVRARQRGVAFAVCEEAEALEELKQLLGTRLLLDLSNDRASFRAWKEADETVESHRQVIPPEVVLSATRKLLPLAEVTPETGGSKAYAAARLEELHTVGKGDFHTAPACVVPFGVMEESLRSRPDLAGEYADMLGRLGDPADGQFSASIERLRDILLLEVPDDIISGVKGVFRGGVRLMVRSSSNLEDMEELSGAGLYDSVANVAPQDVAGAIQKVWASLWTRRAALGRMISGISHEKAHMAVLIQQMIAPEYSFIIHTENPINASADEVYVEMAVGLGETLASGRIPGIPYRMIYDRRSGKVQVLSFASFSKAVAAGRAGKTEEKTIDYASVRLSVDDTFRNLLVTRLGKTGAFVEESFGGPQDIEGVVTGDKIYLVQSRPQQGSKRRPGGPATCRVMGLFQKRIEGDDALLSLARMRFRQAGLGAEYYAETPEELDNLLKFSPPGAAVTVHLPRDIDLFRDGDRKSVVDFSRCFGKKIYGMVLHDQKELTTRLKDYAAVLGQLDSTMRKNGGHLFIEYASGLAPDIFFRLFEEISDLDHVSCCIDTGHLGLHYVRTAFESRRPGKDIFSMKPDDPSLSLYLDDIQASVESALDGVLSLIRKLAALGKPLHLHLHDGHPLSVASPFGVSDHLSFLDRILIPVQYKGENVLPPMFGPSGLSMIVKEAIKVGRDRVSFMLEIHPTSERLALGDAAHLFEHWRDKGNAERMNHWLSVMAANGRLVLEACGEG